MKKLIKKLTNPMNMDKYLESMRKLYGHEKPADVFADTPKDTGKKVKS